MGLARLFVECHWTQEAIAARMGQSQQWVSCRLRFGRFLRFTTRCSKTEPLPEGSARHDDMMTDMMT